MMQGTFRPRRQAAGLAILLLLAATHAAAVTGGNDFYTVQVEADPNSFGIGLYTVATGPSHPVTGMLGQRDILFGGTLRPGQSFTTIRSWTSGTDYLQNNGVLLLASAPPTLHLENFVLPGEAALPLGDPNHPRGYKSIYRIGGAASAPDALRVEQVVEALGTVFNESAVRIETSITNVGASTVELGVRYLWDFRIGFDDGPTYRERDPDGMVLGTEVSRTTPLFETFEIVDNNQAAACFTSVNPSVPFFAVRGSVTGPASLSPTPPTRLDYVAWPQISGLAGLVFPALPQPSAFGYTNTGTDAATCDISLDDSGMAYWWGDAPSNALRVPAGATVTVSAYIFGHLPGAPPTFPPPPGHEGPFGDPTCDDGVDNDGDGQIDEDDPDCAPPPGDEGPPGDPSCDDGLDNDGDGLIDEDDPDCVPPNEPPDCTRAAPTVGELWPPNHKMKEVAVKGVTDPDGDPVTVKIVAIAQDEPLNTVGDGNTCPDAAGVGSSKALLRPERSGLEDGRVYHVSFEAADGRGGVCTGAVGVCVPHDQSKKKTRCVDQGPRFNSLGPCGAGSSPGNGKKK